MIDVAKKWWKYLTAKLTRNFNEKADPKVQLEQAITEAQNQHKRLKDQATNVIANQKQAEIRLNNKMGELEKLNLNARQALVMASDAEKGGDTDKATQYTQAAETIADKLISVEADVESLKRWSSSRPQAADQAQGRGEDQQSTPAGEAGREVETAQPARAGEDARRDERGDGPAQRDRRRRRTDVRRGRRRRSRPATPRRRRPLELEADERRVSVLEIEEATANVAAQSRLAELRTELGLTPAAVESTASPTTSTELPHPSDATTCHAGARHRRRRSVRAGRRGRRGG